ncbi:MAG: hypothetical protein KatS3mg021_1635 [Fimbriimonadales bacterium]|nr:MAG: hypothetical protein KatS3mg021_1635 [Fimbriimonadales bacterium]
MMFGALNLSYALSPNCHLMKLPVGALNPNESAYWFAGEFTKRTICAVLPSRSKTESPAPKPQ